MSIPVERLGSRPTHQPSKSREFAATAEWRLLLLITLTALSLRLIWVLTVHTGLGEYYDPQWYFGTAKNLAEGHGMTIRVVSPQGYLPGAGGIQAIVWPQGYPLTLAGVFKLFGASLTVGKLLNVVANTLVVPLTFLLARRSFGSAVALVAATLFAVYPANIFWTSVLYSDVVFTAPFAIATVLLVYAGVRPTPGQALAIGFAIGYALIIRPQAIVLLPAGFSYWALGGVKWSDSLRPLGYALIAVAAFVIPNAVWNTTRTGELAVLSNNFGYNLRIGHAPYSTGRYIFPTDLWTSSHVDPASGDLPSESLAIRRSIDYAFHHPIDELTLSGKKVFYLYSTDSDSVIWASTFDTTPIWGSSDLGQRLINVTDGVTYLTLVLALLALPLTFSLRDERLLLWLILGFWTAEHVVFFGDARYHLPVLPIILTMTAVAIVQGWRMLASDGEPRTIDQADLGESLPQVE